MRNYEIIVWDRKTSFPMYAETRFAFRGLIKNDNAAIEIAKDIVDGQFLGGAYVLCMNGMSVVARVIREKAFTEVIR